MSSDLQKEMRFGNLLIQLGLLNDADLQEAAQLAIELGLPLGKVLVMSDFISDELLQALLQAQSMLKDQVVTLDEAKKALDVVAQKKLSWSDALRESGWEETKLLPSNKLGRLLLEAEIISEDDLEEALIASQSSGLPLGRILALHNKISDTLVYSCLNAQVLLRDGKITREQAMKALRGANARRMSIEQELIDQGAYRAAPKARIKIGEMFVLAGILHEDVIMEAIEFGLINEEPVGQILIHKGHINLNQLDTALKLQEMVDNGSLSPIHAADVLKQIDQRNIPLAQAVTELGLAKEQPPGAMPLSDLLRLAGVITEEDVQEAFRRSMQNSALLGKILSITGFADEDTVNAALRCQSLLKHGVLQPDQAIIALNYSIKMRRSLDEALIELGWSHNTKPVELKKTGTATMSAQQATQWYE